VITGRLVLLPAHQQNYADDGRKKNEFFSERVEAADIEVDRSHGIGDMAFRHRDGVHRIAILTLYEAERS
jgi:hypothetical protein